MTSKRARKMHVLTILALLSTVALLIVSVPEAGYAQHVPTHPLPTPDSALVPMGSGNLFLRAVPYNSGGRFAYSVAVADVNGDGKPDLLVVNGNGGTTGSVGVLLGNGDGTFQAAVTYDPGGNQTSSIAVADLNGDGKPDLVVTNTNTSNTVGVLLGNGDGTFRPVVIYSSGGGAPWSVAVADVNGDGKPDILVADNSSCSTCSDKGLVGVLLGNGDGTFQPPVTFSSGGYDDFGSSSLAVLDLNGDGKLDVVVTNACGLSSGCTEKGSVGVLLGNGDGTFQSAVNYASNGRGVTSVAVSDVNGDGKPDLLVTNGNCPSTGDCGRGTVAVLLGNGNGTFQPAHWYGSGGDGADSVAVADVNGDGKPDLIVANVCPYITNGACSVGGKTGIVGVLLGNGDGTFQPAAPFGSGGFWIADHIAVADVNNDGRPDVLVVNLVGVGSQGSVGVLLNETPQ